MTETEIMKVLECCKKDDCDHCPNDFGNCYANLAGYALALINRKNAEIDRLTAVEESHREQNGKLRKEVDRLLQKLQQPNDGAECPICHGTGKIGTTDWLTKDMSAKQLAKEKAEAIAEANVELRAKAIKEFADVVKFKAEEPWLYSKKAICRILDQIAKEMGVEL